MMKTKSFMMKKPILFLFLKRDFYSSMTDKHVQPNMTKTCCLCTFNHTQGLTKMALPL